MSTLAGAATVRFDLVLTALTPYTASDASLNGLAGRFARINFAANTNADLRVRVFASCCGVQNCVACASLSGAERSQCYAAGCCCYGRTCTSTDGTDCCTGAQAAQWRASYGCDGVEHVPLVLPTTSMVGFSVFDLDSGENGEGDLDATP